VADRIAAKGGLWVVMPELLDNETAWPRSQFPPESVWKNRFADWLRNGPGSWPAIRDRVATLAAALLEEAAAAASEWPVQPQAAAGGGGGEAAVRLAVGGIGWGALMALHSGCDRALAPEVLSPLACVAALTPALYGRDEKLAAELAAPIVILPAKYDNMDRLQVFLSKRKHVYGPSVFKRFGFVYSGPLSWSPGFTDYDPDSTPLKLKPRDGKVRHKGGKGRLEACRTWSTALLGRGGPDIMRLGQRWRR
jgi:hypothetical protein